ncbi:MAG: peptide chain release factor 3 [Bdellovibrionaceae bacterium]|jgi:peptide chain release factor 3|nr:peptide chain release factor 3 [Pseudobdellovibrionaceae bacterium]
MVTEAGKRRTFAIISHPDAGKTTITEKLLYHGGAIRETGEVKGKSGKKAAMSDWMTLEKERGISITSSVMQFMYGELKINLLDTPGHKDFGEDTYRTLIAADSAAMLIDAAKGVEKQTRQLFDVCRMRKIPIFTFANKMDREGIDSLELIDDVESTLGIKCIPMTWPIGMGDRFRGLFHRMHNKLYLYEKGKVEPEVIAVSSWEDPIIKEYVSEELYEKFLEDMELLEIALGPFEVDDFLRGDVSPMSFGSAKNNWGVDLFLEIFAKYAPAPQPREFDTGSISPDDKEFSGFIFKIQANMDKKHRDRIAFLRVCSGEFERGMKVKHMRLNRELRLAYASEFMAKDRGTVDNAFAGDIVGIVDTGNFQIGDSISSGKKINFPPFPKFSPEMFASLYIKDPLKKKRLQKGVNQLAEEGAIQVFIDPLIGEQEPLIGVVGELQFEVLLYRLNDEYNLDVRLDRLPYSVARWPKNKHGEDVSDVKGAERMFQDSDGNPVVLLAQAWDIGWLEKENPDVEFMASRWR